MNSNGQTSVSGLRVSNNSRREEAPVPPSKRMEFVAHFFLVLLALAIWWIARDMVSVERQLQSAALVQVKLDPALDNIWRIDSKSSFPIGLTVTGPNREINQFESSIAENPGLVAYSYTISKADLKAFQNSSDERITVGVELSRMSALGEGPTTAELKVQPIISERKFSVTLERFITRKAKIDLESGIKGEISGYALETKLHGDFAVEVFGPASRVNAVAGSDGYPLLLVNADIKQAIETIARVEDKPFEEILRLGQVITSLPITRVEGIVVRMAGTSDEVAQVNVSIKITELQNYVSVDGTFPVDVMMPNWLMRKGARISEMPKGLQVQMQVLNTQRNDFDEKYLQVVIDLSSLTEEGAKIIGPEGGGPGKRTMRISNLYYALVIDTTRLTYKFQNPELTADRYLPTEVEIVWSE
ncbi:MAG: hypothetical protein L3J82_01345 [Planctomycetes bacterium]|nr:hypothetical protein [Planctomycetota bacterium]